MGNFAEAARGISGDAWVQWTWQSRTERSVETGEPLVGCGTMRLADLREMKKRYDFGDEDVWEITPCGA